MTAQLILPFVQSPPTWRDLVQGDNFSLITQLTQTLEHLKNQTLDAKPSLAWDAQRFVYIWGEEGSGLTFLLRVIAQAAIQASLPVIEYHLQNNPPAELTSNKGVVLVDDIDLLNANQLQNIFNLYNTIRSHANYVFIATSHNTLQQLTIREDLRTRLGWGQVSQLLPLKDDHKREFLLNSAKNQGLKLSDDVIHYLLTHFYRDLPSLADFFAWLNLEALRHQRAITVPFIKQILQKP